MADEDTGAPDGATGASDDVEASRMLDDALNSEGNDESTDAEKPQEGETFDAEQAKAKITKANREAQNLRKRVKELEPLAQEAQKLRDSQKSEAEKLNERTAAAEGRATAAELASMRLDVALDAAPDGMPVSKVRALAKRLTGKDREELEADAKELFAEFAPAPKEERQDPPEKVRLPNSDRLKVDDETNPAKLAAGIRRL